MLEEFRKFATRGNVVDMAVGVIIGASFGKIITSLVNDVLMPPVGLILGKVDFSNLFLDLSGKHYATLAEAKAAGAPTVNVGVFLNSLIDFMIVAFVIFLVVRQVNRFSTLLQGEQAAEAPSTKDCPFCLSTIPVKATRCAHCTSALQAA